MKKLLSTLISVFFTLYLFSQDFEVSPVDIQFNARAGEVVVKKVTIRNYSNNREKFSAVYSDYEILKDGRKMPVKKEDAKHSMGDWLNISPAFFELNPNEEKTIDVTLSVPHNGDGTRWGKIGIQPAIEQTATSVDKTVSTGVLIKPRITIWVTQSPKGSTNYSATIKNLVEESNPTDSIRRFSFTVNNTGGNIIEAKTFLTISNIITAKEKRYTTTTNRIYPGASKQITLTIPEKLAKGHYVVAAILDYGHRKALEGTQIMIKQE